VTAEIIKQLLVAILSQAKRLRLHQHHPPTTIHQPRVSFAIALSLAIATQAAAEEQTSRNLIPGEISGFIAAESRVFLEDEQFPDQMRWNNVGSFVLQPEWYYEWNGGRDAILFVPFFRADPTDERRTHYDLRELNYLHVGDGWEARVGFAKVFWGVAESNHLVDIINQTDAVEDVDREDKLGQPMIHLTAPTWLGIFELFALPGFRNRTFPGPTGRLRPSIVVAQDDPDFDSSLGHAHVDFAGRWSRTFGDWEAALSHFYGTSRDPRFELDLIRNRLIPLYDIINQTGVELQYTGANILLKLEGFGRDGQSTYRGAVVGGFEYTFYEVFNTACDLGVLGEGHYDSFDPEIPVDVPNGPLPPPDQIPPDIFNQLQGAAFLGTPSPFEHDLFGGFRLTFNDEQSTELLAGVIADVVDGGRFWNVEASRRFGSNWKLNLDVRVFDSLPGDTLFAAVNKDDFVQLSLAYYF
jgi:hypothetical protein